MGPVFVLQGFSDYLSSCRKWLCNVAMVPMVRNLSSSTDAGASGVVSALTVSCIMSTKQGW